MSTLNHAVSRIQNREQTAAQTVMECMKRIDAWNGELNAFIHVSPNAISDARKLDEWFSTPNNVAPPLAGAPIAVKDLIDMVSMPATYGAVHKHPERNREDASVVARLVEAGAVIVGKTNLDEYAFRTTSVNPHFGIARNPWNRDRIAGGSSGGSAISVATKMSVAAIGTDTGGSIRIPAALTGIVGYKPSFGAVSRFGVFPLASSLDHVGPMARTVGDVRTLMKVIAGRDERDPDSYPLPQWESTLRTLHVNEVRIGIPVDDFFSVGDKEVLHAVARTALGLDDCRTSKLQWHSAPVRIPLLAEAAQAQAIILSSEALYVHHERLQTEPDLYGAPTRRRLEDAKQYLGCEYVWAKNVQRAFQREIAEIFESVDILMLPTTPIGAPRVAEETVVLDGIKWAVPSLLTRYTNLWNLAGVPAITLPCGLTDEGLPIGVQLVSGRFEDNKLLWIAERMESWLPRAVLPPEYE